MKKLLKNQEDIWMAVAGVVSAGESGVKPRAHIFKEQGITQRSVESYNKEKQGVEVSDDTNIKIGGF